MSYLIPPRKRPSTNEEYFEVLCKAVFQAGFSYKVVNSKWSDISNEFEHFDFSRIANWEEDKIMAVVQSPKIIRNLKKIRGIVVNSKIFKQLVDKHGSFEKYLATFRDQPYKKRSKILSEQFKWLGKTGTYFFLWSVEEEVPEWTER